MYAASVFPPKFLGKDQVSSKQSTELTTVTPQNKTNSAVQIIHKPSGVVVKCQATRSRSQNEKIARQLLADKVEAREKGDQSRVALKAEAARKKKASKMKKAKRKYRALENEEGGVEDGAVENGHHEIGEDGTVGSGGKGSSV